MSQTRYTLEDLKYLMARLRHPEHGCPWDLKQDFASIVPHTIEETYEVVDAIERRDWPHLADELGDLLFQVVFYAQLGDEIDAFDLDAVVDGIVRKLVRRHPHVFVEGELYAEPPQQKLTEAEIKANWEAIKRQEREAKAELQDEAEKPNLLADIPRSLPTLSRAQKLQQRASTVGFDWTESVQVLDKIEEEIAELREAMQSGDIAKVQDEMGDVLFAQVNLARHVGVSADLALGSTNSKFIRRFDHVERRVRETGRDWSEFTLEQLDDWWDEAKLLGL